MRNSTTSLFTRACLCGLYLLTLTRLAAAELPVMPKILPPATNPPPDAGKTPPPSTAAGTAAGTTTGTTTVKSAASDDLKCDVGTNCTKD